MLLPRESNRRRAMPNRKEKCWASINEGEKRTGVVTKIAKFGAFVDIGGVKV